MKNKFLALVLSVITLLLCCVQVFANDVSSAVVATEGDVDLSKKLEILGVISADLPLMEHVTKGEMAGLIADFMSLPEHAQTQTVFEDVTAAHMHSGDINALYQMGIISGDDNGLFYPDTYVTYEEVLVFVINAIGYKPLAQREGGYPTGYHRIAMKLDMLQGISQVGNSDAVAADVYRILSAALTAPTVIQNYFGNGDVTYALSETETFLTEVYGIKRFRGVVTGVEGTRLSSATSNIKEDYIEIDGNVYMCSGYGRKSLLGYNVDFYLKEDEPETILYIEKTPKRNETIRIHAKDLVKTKTTETRIYYQDENGKDRHINLDDLFDLVYNDQAYAAYGVLEAVLPDTGHIEALDNNGDGTYDVLFVYSYRDIVVESVDSYNQTVMDKITGEVIDLSDYDQSTDIYFADGEGEVEFTAIRFDDVISVYESMLSPKIIKAYISRNVIYGGTVESYESYNGYYIGGKWYKTASDMTIDLGMTADFYLDMNGDIAYYNNPTSKGQRVAVMAGLEYKNKSASNDVSVRLFTDESTFLDATLRNRVKINGKDYSISNREEREEVLKILSRAEAGNDYTLESAYVVLYTLTPDGKISSLDSGMGGQGNLNILTQGSTSLLVRWNYILRYTNHYNTVERRRFDKNNGIAFTAPEDGNLGDVEGYSVVTLKQERYYHKSTSYTYVDSFDIYTYANNSIPMADIILFRNYTERNSTGISNAVKVVTEVTTAVNDEGKVIPKIYMGDASYILAEEVSFKRNSDTGTIYDAMDLVNGTTPFLRPGIAIRYSLNNENEIAGIAIQAEYDSESGELTPAFTNENTYMLYDYDTPEVGSSNFVVGTVTKYDAETEQLLFTTDSDAEYLMYISAPTIYVYREGCKELVLTSAAEIVPGDKFVASLDAYYVPSTMYIFR